MREIKFKVWVPYSNVMMQPKDIQTLHESILNGVTIGQMKQWHYLQFTGLKDKNGKDIYEGDIVKVYDQKIREVEFKNVFWQLELCENAQIGGFGTPVEAGHKPLYRYPEKWIEVIGNIYENPELMHIEQKAQVSDTTKMP